LYQGQRYTWQKNRRGTPALDQPPMAFVVFLENHDQVANSGRGLRCHQLTSPGRLRAMTALTLLGPNTPMLFQGQEFCASTPFLYFADHKPDLASAVGQGRRKFLSQFPSLALDQMQKLLPDPADPATFERCKLKLAEREQHAAAYALHRDLLRLRREDPVFRQPRPRGVDGAVLGPEAFVLRFFGGENGQRLLLVNLGRDLRLDPAPEPLLAPPEDARWQILWSSEDPRYDGNGTPDLDAEMNWKIPGQAAVVLIANPV
jgi:maltooligosyltrehalose trehalohydrolase